jgi:hypothetical protein
LDSKKKTTTTTTTDRTLTERVTTTLTREEELVVRLSRGLSETGDYPLEFRGQRDADSAARLALVEAALLAEMYEVGPLAEVEDASEQTRSSVDSGLKSRILDKLSKLSD